MRSRGTTKGKATTFLFVAATLATLSGKARAQVGIGEVLGGISNVYGTFQAGQFVYSLIAEGSSLELSTAVTELQNFMMTYRDQALVNDVQGVLQQFRYISQNPNSAIINQLEANFTTDAINTFSQIQGDIQTGTPADAEMLAPAFNLLSALMTAGWTAFGLMDPANATSATTINSYFDQTMALNYSMAGGIYVTMDAFCQSPECFYIYTQGAKTIWQNYDTGYSVWTKLPTHEDQTSNRVVCDFSLACNTNSSLLTCCYNYYNGYGGTEVTVAPMTGDLRTNALNTLEYDRERFYSSQSVQAIELADWGLITLGHNVVIDWTLPPGNLYIPFGIGHILL